LLLKAVMENSSRGNEVTAAQNTVTLIAKVINGEHLSKSMFTSDSEVEGKLLYRWRIQYEGQNNQQMVKLMKNFQKTVSFVRNLSVSGLQLLEKQTVAFLKRSDSEAGLTAPLPLLSPGAAIVPLQSKDKLASPQQDSDLSKTSSASVNQADPSPTAVACSPTGSAPEGSSQSNACSTDVTPAALTKSLSSQASSTEFTPATRPAKPQPSQTAPRSSSPNPAVKPAVPLQPWLPEDEWEGETDEWCHLCKVGGDLVCCSWCPRIYHLKCLGLNKRTCPKDLLCPQHICAAKGCGLMGKLYRCVVCPCAFCPLHLPITDGPEVDTSAEASTPEGKCEAFDTVEYRPKPSFIEGYVTCSRSCSQYMADFRAGKFSDELIESELHKADAAVKEEARQLRALYKRKKNRGKASKDGDRTGAVALAVSSGSSEQQSPASSSAPTQHVCELICPVNPALIKKKTQQQEAKSNKRSLLLQPPETSKKAKLSSGVSNSGEASDEDTDTDVETITNYVTLPSAPPQSDDEATESDKETESDTSSDENNEGTDTPQLPVASSSSHSPLPFFVCEPQSQRIEPVQRPGKIFLEQGISCHQCKNKKNPDSMFRCNGEAMTQKKACKKKYCISCVTNHYSHISDMLSTKQGVCPSCRGFCTCARCKAARMVA